MLPTGFIGTTRLQQMAALSSAPQHQSPSKTRLVMLRARAAWILAVGYGLTLPLRCAPHGRLLRAGEQLTDEAADGRAVISIARPPVEQEKPLHALANGRFPHPDPRSATGRFLESKAPCRKCFRASWFGSGATLKRGSMQSAPISWFLHVTALAIHIPVIRQNGPIGSEDFEAVSVARQDRAQSCDCSHTVAQFSPGRAWRRHVAWPGRSSPRSCNWLQPGP